MEKAIQEKMMNDASAVYDWSFGVIMGERMPAGSVAADNDGNHCLWKCSVCRERVSKQATEIIGGVPVCWGCIDEKMMKV